MYRLDYCVALMPCYYGLDKSYLILHVNNLSRQSVNMTKLISTKGHLKPAGTNHNTLRRFYQDPYYTRMQKRINHHPYFDPASFLFLRPVAKLSSNASR